MITVTKKAADKIKEISEADGLGHNFIRLKVIGGGCAGLNYDLYFDNQPTSVDEVFSEHEVSIVIDPLSFQYLDGITIDYEVREFAEGFKFINPNVTKICGCGNSFSV